MSPRRASSLADDPLSEFLAEGGAVVAGSAALFGTVAYMIGAVIRDTGLGDAELEPLRWAENGARVGGAFGLAVLIFRTLGLH